jgi:autotransporter-associated beta strand protein
MNTQHNSPYKTITRGLLALLCLALAGTSALAATYQWFGTTSTAWTTAGNWGTGSGLTAGPAPTNVAAGHRLNVYSLGNSLTITNICVYDASLGTTVFGSNNVRGVVVGSTGSGHLMITGGTLSTANATNGTAADIVGNGNVSGVVATMTIAGGNYISGPFGLSIGNQSGFVTGTLNVNSGTATITTNLVDCTASTVNLNGGTLSTRTIIGLGGAGGSGNALFNRTLNLNGGTLTALTNSGNLIAGLSRAQIRNGGAIINTAGFNVGSSQALIHSTVGGDNATDGGLTKLGVGTLTLTNTGNTYTGPTRVNQGEVAMKLPSSSSSLTLVSGTTLTLSPNASLWSTTTTSLTNSTLNYNYGAFDGTTTAVLDAPTLNLSGTVTINILGTGFPIVDITLLTYTTKNGGGSFALGTIPAGAVATLQDTGSAVILHITSPSIQNLVWSASGNNNFQTNGAANWNSGAATYLEYAGLADNVIFDDTFGGGAVNIVGAVRPNSIAVNVSSSTYTFVGSGSINGTNGIAQTGTSTLTICSSNNFTGIVSISGGSGTSGGTLYVSNSFALGATNGGTVVSGPANTLEIGVPGGTGVTVSGESVTITGTGVGGTRGALRGAAVASGTNVWAGPVVIGADLARIGTEDSGNLTVSGPISDGGANYTLVVRPGASGTVVVASAGSSYGATRTFSDGTGTFKVGANNAFSTNALQMGPGTMDLNGFTQTFGGISDNSGTGTFLNNGAAPGTLAINTGTNNFSSAGNLQDGTGVMNLVKSGSGVQTLNGATVSYTGTTTVSGGRLNLASTLSLVSSITVGGSAALSGEFTTTGSLTLNANSTLYADPTTAGSITANSIDATASPIFINFTAAASTNAPTLVMTAAGGITGSAANFQVTGSRTGTFYLTNANTQLMYLAANPGTVTWKGNNVLNPTFWDSGITTNWTSAGNPDRFFLGDAAIFDDTASSFNVAVQGSSILPGSVTFSNTANAYTVSGGAIAGAAQVTKSGTNTLTFNNANTYSGGTVLNTNSGTLVVVSTTTGLGSGSVTIGAGSAVQLYSTPPSTSTTFANTFLGEGTVKIAMSSGSSANTYLPNIGGFAGTIELINSTFNLSDVFNSAGVVAPNLTVQIDTGTTFYVSTSTTVSNILVTGSGNFTTYGALRMGGATLDGNITLLGSSTFGFTGFGTINGNVTGTATAGNTNLLTLGTATLPNNSGILNGVISDGTNGGAVALTQANNTRTLTANNTYSGVTTINSGTTLALSGSGSISNTAAILMSGSATFDVSSIGGFSLGAAQTLSGSGTVSGSVIANGTIVPGGSTIGTLNFNSDLTVNGNLKFDLKKGQAQSNDVVNVSGVLTNSGTGTLTVTLLGTNALVVGDQFTLFSQPLQNGNALTIVPPAGVTFTNNLAVDGSIAVLSIAPAVNTNPTNITVSVSGNTLNLSWPADHLGWTLQTNSLSLANTNFWFPYPGSSALTNVAIPMNPSQTNVFFRLVYP